MKHNTINTSSAVGLTVALAAAGALVATSYAPVQAQAARTVLDGVYTQAQSTRGAAVYAQSCAACHGANLAGDIGPALSGARFVTKWKEKSVGDIFEKIKTSMPASAPGTLTPEQTADVVSHILSVNKYAAGTNALAMDATPLKNVKMAEPPGGPVAAAAPAPPRTRPTLVLSENWKETTETGDISVTQQHVANANLELKTYGPGAKGLMITGSAANPQNPTHVWTGLCETGKCALTLRDKTNFLDLSGQAKIRWVSKVSGFQKIHPIVKLADGTFLAGDWADGSTGDWRESEAYFAEMRWVKMDAARVATTGPFLDKVDLSKVDEIGWSDFMVASGHGQGGWSDVGKIEVYGKAVPR